MRTFDVFARGGSHFKAVKRGWSWPAFFFGSIWAICSSLWVLGIVFLPIELILNFLAGVVNQDTDQDISEAAIVITIAIGLPSLAIRVVFANEGNRWRAKNLKSKGYKLVLSALSATKEEAITSASIEVNLYNGDISSNCTSTKKNVGNKVELNEFQTDIILVFLAGMLLLVVCLVSVIGIILAIALIAGLCLSLRFNDYRYVKVSSDIVIATLYIVAAGLFVWGFYEIFEPAESRSQPIEDSIILISASLVICAGAIALRYIWVYPLQRQLDNMRSWISNLRLPSRPVKQNIVAREALHPFSVADELAKWKALHNDGVITDEEYATARRRLLNSE